MAENNRINSGTLWINENKQGDKYPDYSGEFNFNNVEFEVAVWKKKTKTGKKLLSFSFAPKKEKASDSSQDAPKEENITVDAGDDIPF